MSFKQIRFGSLKPEERMKIYGASQISLCRGEEGILARRWLCERGLDIQTISDFRLGYVPFSVDHSFAGRIVIPIFDTYSKLLALSVRPATDDKTILDEYRKYWNESYEKGWQLFGLNLAKFHIVRMGFAILVEGQFDVMAMHSFGFPNTVGVLGGAFTPMQAELIRRWSGQLVLMFDGDAPGRKHSERCQQVLNYYGFPALQNRKADSIFKSANVNLAGGKDPNDFLKRYGAWSMRKTIGEAMTGQKMTLPKDW